MRLSKQLLLIVLCSAAFAPVVAQTTAKPKVYTVSAFEFVPVEPDTHMVTSGHARYPEYPGLGSGSLIAPVHLPDGAHVVAFEVEYVRKEGTRGALMVEYDEYCTGAKCHKNQGGESSYIADPLVGHGRDRVFVFRPPVNNETTRYMIRAEFSAKGGDISLTVVRVYYHMRVAPVSGRHSDVPETRTFSERAQAVEASAEE